MRSVLLALAILFVSSTAFAAGPYHRHHNYGHTYGGYYGGGNIYDFYNFGAGAQTTFGYGYYNGRVVPFYAQTYSPYPSYGYTTPYYGGYGNYGWGW